MQNNITITFWKHGYSVDNGVLLDPTVQKNKEELENIAKGYVHALFINDGICNFYRIYRLPQAWGIESYSAQLEFKLKFRVWMW